MATIIYWLGIKGYMASQAVQLPLKKIAAPQLLLSTTSIQQAVDALTNCMQADKLFLNPALNLEAVALHTGLAQKNISAVLNQHMHKSFNEFVNEYRVNAFIEKMQQPAWIT